MKDETTNFNAITTVNGDIVPYTMIVLFKENEFFYDILGNLHRCVETERENYLQWLKRELQ